jgi:rare lipoprotein A (peptidoglycan hydrolase)
MIMRTPRTATTILLALLAATACVAPSASALADTASATGGATAGAPAKTKVHRTGIATWFGPGFYGQATACGQMLTPAVVGVANRTLPCGTLVKVTYKGHALVVPVLDRGPYANHADWDLTAGAAQALNIADTVRVGTRVVGAAPNTPLLGSPPVTPAEAATGGAQAAG